MPPAPGPFTGRTVAALAQDLRHGRTTSAELTERALAAIADTDAELRAFVTVDAEGATAAARRADEELSGGGDRGPLHGVPVAVKDLIMVAGLPITMGSAHFAGHVPEADAECVRRLRQAGAVIVGTTRTHQFAYGATGDRSAGGPARNPWDRTRMTGGSSSGSGAAVAAGLVPLALGTDTGGSVRIPAALCGVAGFKPAYGMIPSTGVFPLSATLDHVGVLAGHPEDCLLAYRLLATPGGQEEDTGPARVAWLDPSGIFPVDPRVERAVRAAAGRTTRAAGPLEELEELTVPPGTGDELREMYAAIHSSEAAAVHADRLAQEPELFDPEVLTRLRAAAEMPGWRYVRAMDNLAGLAETLDALFDRHDVLALPTTAITAPPLDLRETGIDGRPVTVRDALLSLTSPWNILRLPALTVPAGTVDGLPVGLQLVCRAGREPLLFEAARAAGSATAGESA
ncbi:amidase [Nonomuraea rhizosphaerae]|uniref:amidase n=1 Tax=Nonomuraea rhizosphaerae TaxID=2665663 RepID=UPI001C60116D|nr:amidase [Nonomuraea rhizosphaerae]